MGRGEREQTYQGTWRHGERDRQTRSLTTCHEKKEIPGWERTGLNPNAVSCSSSLNCL